MTVGSSYKEMRRKEQNIAVKFSKVVVLKRSYVHELNIGTFVDNFNLSINSCVKLSCHIYENNSLVIRIFH